MSARPYQHVRCPVCHRETAAYLPRPGTATRPGVVQLVRHHVPGSWPRRRCVGSVRAYAPLDLTWLK